MKISKIILSAVALSSILLVQTVSASFSDVPSDHPNFDAISYVENARIVQGYTDGTYLPDAEINRAEFTKILIMSKFDTSGLLVGNTIDLCIPSNVGDAPTTYFDDVPTNSWFAAYVCVAKTEGIIDGYEDGTFKPEAPINFAEAAKIIVNTYEMTPTANMDPWFRPYVEALTQQYSVPNTIMSFSQNITRGEMAEIIYRLDNELMDKTYSAYSDLIN